MYDSSGRGSSDEIRVYLSQMAAIPLLTKDEEARLARCIDEARAGFLAALPSELRSRRPRDHEGSPSPRAFRTVLGTLGKRGLKALRALEAYEEAIRALAAGNLRLVVSVARRYRGAGLPLLDLVQEGNAGLLRAAEKFDLKHGCKFATYATWWIRQAILRSLALQARHIRLPARALDRAARLQQALRALTHRLGREPSIEEVAEAAGVSHIEARRIAAANRGPVSLDRTVPGEDDDDLSVRLSAPGNQAPEEPVEREAVREAVHRLLDVLPPRERNVLRLRFGIGRQAPATLEEIGRHLGVTRERVRQLEISALRRLRIPAGQRSLGEPSSEETATA